MIRDITIGQYYPSGSKIHKLDPRVKLFATLLFIISIFIKRSFLIYGIAAFVLIVCIAVSKVPVRFMMKGLKPVWILLVFTCIVNIFFVKGETLLFHFKFINIYQEGVTLAAYRVVRLVELILGSSLMTYTTTPTELTDGLEQTFHPLTKLHIPVHEIALMMSITLRFIPILTEESDRIMKAQTARGVDFDQGNVIQKLKRSASILMPLFSSAVGRAGDLALAMEARCYQTGVPRTKMYPLHYQKWDILGYTLAIIYFAAMICIKIMID